MPLPQQNQSLVGGHERWAQWLSVARFKPGDRVGVGCMVDSCQKCAACDQGLEQYCENFPTYVTLFTRSLGKEQDARRLGAHDVVLSTDAKQMATVNGRFELIIDTVPYAHDLNPYLPTLSLDDTSVLLGYLSYQEPQLNTTALVLGRKAVAGSVIGGIAETQEMLDFLWGTWHCVRHRSHQDSGHQLRL